jgi:hypothetical protein
MPTIGEPGPARQFILLTTAITLNDAGARSVRLAPRRICA